MKTEKVAEYLIEVTHWTSTQADILALALAGSHARDVATETSDVDLVLVTVDPKRYLENADWVGRFGTVEKQQVEDHGR